MNNSKQLKTFVIAMTLAACSVVVQAASELHDVNDRTRDEKVAIFRDKVFGRRPVDKPDYLKFAEETAPVEMLDGAAVRKQTRITYGGKYGTNSFVVTTFLPKARPSAPAFLLICNREVEKFADPARKVKSGFWPVEEIISRGYAAVMFFNGDIAPDIDVGCSQGVFACFEKVPRKYRPTNSWGTISAWAWGASRVMDWMETEPGIDSSRVAVVGHSRGGKTSLWTAVTDTRFAYACVNNSGCSGAKLNHMDLPKSEHIADIVKNFNYWFCHDYVMCVNRDDELDFDQHELLSCMAPRLLAVASAQDDFWAGPAGERKALELASEAWQDKSRVKYHIRKGGHNLTLEDWKAYLDHADANGWGVIGNAQTTKLGPRVLRGYGEMSAVCEGNRVSVKAESAEKARLWIARFMYVYRQYAIKPGVVKFPNGGGFVAVSREGDKVYFVSA